MNFNSWNTSDGSHLCWSPGWNPQALGFDPVVSALPRPAVYSERTVMTYFLSVCTAF